MSTFRAVAIMLVGAAVIAFVPTGGDVAAVASRALNVAFLAVLAFGAAVVYRTQRGRLLGLETRTRAALYTAVAALAFAVTGYRWLTLTTARSLVFVAILAAATATLFVIWQRERRLS